MNFMTPPPEAIHKLGDMDAKQLAVACEFVLDESEALRVIGPPPIILHVTLLCVCVITLCGRTTKRQIDRSVSVAIHITNVQ